MSTPPLPPPRPFYRKKRSWILLILVLLCATVGGIWWNGNSTVTAQLQKLRAQGLPTTASEVNDYYVVPEGVADTTELWVRAIDAAVNSNLAEAGEKLPIVGLSETPIPPPGEEWDQLQECCAVLTEFHEELSLIHEAAAAGGVARMPVDFSAGIYTALPLTQESRNVTRWLNLDAHVSAHDGDHAQALQDILGIFAASDMLQAEPTLISQLIRMAFVHVGCQITVELIEHCDWSDADLATLQKAVAAADFKQGIRTAFCGERGLCLTSLSSLPLGPFRQANARMVLQFIQQALDGLNQPWTAAIDEAAKVNAEIFRLASGKVTRFSLVGVTTTLPAMEQAMIAAARTEAQRNATVTAIAAQRYRLQHGEFPASIAEIPAEYLPPDGLPLTVDPFDSGPLRYVVDHDGVLIYSIGEDRRDDGGVIEQGDERPPDTRSFHPSLMPSVRSRIAFAVLPRPA